MNPALLLFFLGGHGPGYEIWTRATRSAASTFVDAVPDDTLSYTLTGLTADSVGYYHIEAVNGCNVRSVLSPSSRLRRVAMDGDNQLIAPAPNAPFAIVLTLGAGGAVAATWQHNNTNAEATAAGFNIYVATGVDAFDYDTVDHAVASSVRSQALGTFANATVVRVVIRARTSGGVEETNTTEATTTADAAAPAQPVTVTPGS